MNLNTVRGQCRTLILSSRKQKDGCFMPVAWGAEDALAAISDARIVTDWGQPQVSLNQGSRLRRKALRIFTATKSRLKTLTQSQQEVVLFLMGLSREVIPTLKDAGLRKTIYLFDTWEPEWDKIEEILNSAKSLQSVFMSSSQAVNHFRTRLNCDIHWLPQAAISSEFSERASDWSNKQKTIVNIGRTNSVLDEFFCEFSRKHGYTYLRDQYPGEAKFKNRGDFLNALYTAQIVVVHPRNLEYPETTGCVSMLTARNFEAYQSGGVVCGFKPDSGEFEDVLSEFPFIEFKSSKQFEADLLVSVDAPASWCAALDRCRQLHTWETRLSGIAQMINPQKRQR